MKTMRDIRGILLLLIWMPLAGALAGCNTTAGFGQDVEAAGSEIEETAEEVKN